MAEIVRQTAKYHPSIWGDQFLIYNSEDILTRGQLQQQADQLKELVRREVFTTCACDVSHQLKLIDDIQRLGVGYHFESEIEEALGRIHAAYRDHNDGDLHNVALRFRLLRQHGYNASCDYEQIA